ncbi:MAG: Dolichyl-phosphate-mannose-protein mannosyltransferase [Thermomicrobiales bacterium]|nr:Dolichyl-phosphate-mannose-protein mannosyltransferase [Thermomicrobiales bacterium]
MRRDLIVVLIVSALSLWQNLDAVDRTPFHPDETRWLNRAHYLAALRDPLGENWTDYFLTRGQPPGGSYLMGLGLLVQGRDLTPNGVWHFSYGGSWNLAQGNVPSQADLDAGRRTNSVAGALTVGIVYLLVRRLTNRLGGLVAALTLAFHPLMIALSSQALSDVLLVLLVAAAALAATCLADRPSWPRALLLGAVLGLGGATKLGPLLLTVPLAVLGGLLLASPRISWLRQRLGVGPNVRRLGERLLPLPAVGFATFVLVYPYLWPDPLVRTYRLFAFRSREMTMQGTYWPEIAVDGRVEAAVQVWHRLGREYSLVGRLGLDRLAGADLAVAVAGLAVFVWLIVRGGLAGRQAVAGVILFGQTALVLGGLRVDFARYYLPLVLTVAVGTGVFAGFLGDGVMRLVPAFSAPTFGRTAAKAGWEGVHPPGREVVASGAEGTGSAGSGVEAR